MAAELVPTAPRELPDTIEDAVVAPSREISWKELGLRVDEYERIVEILDRRPANVGLVMYSVMWSEHCNYKSSKRRLVEQFGKRTNEEMKRHLLVGTGQSAGVVDIGDGWAITFKVEFHDHPSSVELYQGATTGVGGVARGIISMGVRPAAVMDQLRLDSVGHLDTARVVHGVVSGVGGYGNYLGSSNIGGETEFDSSHQGSPFVNALYVGILCHEDIHLTNVTGEGDLVVLFGTRIGGDGIGGASILASKTFEDGTPAKRPSVQVGDPSVKKVLVEYCLGLFRTEVVQDIQDLGAASISCTTSELASDGDPGIHVDLERVLLCGPSLTAGEILMSESQEHVMVIVIPEDEEHFFEIIDKWDVEASIIGGLTGDDRLTIDHFGHRIVDMDPKTVAHEDPVYDHPYARPLWQDELQASTSAALARPSSSEELVVDIMSVPANVNQASKTWVTDQYDRYAQGNTALAQPDDADVVRVDEESDLGVTLATDASGWCAKLDPAMGTKQALAESYRNVTVVGAGPVAITDCLNFGNPKDTDAMWQLVTTMTTLADGCVKLGIPVADGNVSLYNSSGTEKNLPDSSINPTPVVSMLGIMEDVDRTNLSGFTEEGLAIVLLGDTRDELNGSTWARIRHGHLGGLPPQVDLSARVASGNVVRALSAAGDPQGRPLIRAAHNLSNGDLAQSLVDMCLHFDVGGSFDLSEAAGMSDLGDFEMLFSESQGHAPIAIHETALPAVYAAAEAESMRAMRIGTSEDELLAVLGTNLLGERERPWIADLGELRAASEAALRDRF